jgi:co-chaperonin GroES (HSP10)
MDFIQAIKDKVVVQEIKTENVTEGGIILPSDVKQEPQLFCKVISFGEDVKGLNVDDVILCHRNAGMAIMVKREIYKVLKYDEIYAIYHQD